MTASASLNKLDDFLFKKSDLDDSIQDAFREVERYWNFLNEIKERVLLHQSEFVATADEIMGAIQRQSGKQIQHPFTQRYLDLMVIVQLDIESFYLFLKIYLDTTARFLGVCLKKSRNIRFESFEKLFQPKAAIWSSSQIFSINNDFRSEIEKLLVEVVGFRDKKIAHPQLPGGRNLIGKRTHAVSWKVDSNSVSLTAAIRGGKENDFYTSTDIKVLWQTMENYTKLFAEFSIHHIADVKQV